MAEPVKAQEQPELPELVPSPRWPLWVSAGFMLLGLVASAGIVLMQPKPPPPTLPTVEEAVVVESSYPNPEGTFARLQDALQVAKTPEERILLAVEMAEFLMDSVGWRPDQERQFMAREYLLALGELDLPAVMRHRLAGYIFRLALQLEDLELLDCGDRILGAGAEGEVIPFELLCAETDAIIELGDSERAFTLIDEVKARTENPEQSVEYLLRLTRGLRRALQDEDCLQVLWDHRHAGGGQPDSGQIQTELSEKSAVLMVSGLTPVVAEGMWNQAFLARQSGKVEEEIAILKQIIEKGTSPFRSPAYVRLADLMLEEGRDQEYAVLLGRMIGRPELRKHAVGELQKRMRKPATVDVAQELLLCVNQVLILGDEMPQPLAQMLLAASQMAIAQGWMPVAEQYLDQAETLTLDRELLADSMVMRAEIAQARGDKEEMIRDYKEVISLYPGHPKEADIRFLLLQEMAGQPYGEADLVGGIIGAVTRLPKDPRGTRGLLMVAKHLEDLELYELAETYYRLSVLLSTMQLTRDVGGNTAEALLGQARTMAAQNKLAEADALLRVINTNTRWSDIWSTSGPLWASLAFRQGQFREGIRRWRNTCGPPGGELLPYLFGLLVPDLAEMSAQIDNVTPKKPGKMPVELVDAAVRAAMDQLIQRDDFEGVERLMGMIDRDSEWKGKLPMNQYRIRTLERLAAKESIDRTSDWLKRYPVLNSVETVKDTEQLTQQLENVKAIRQRVRALR